MPSDPSGLSGEPEIFDITAEKLLFGIALILVLTAVCYFLSKYRSALSEVSANSLRTGKEKDSPKTARAVKLSDSSRKYRERASAGIAFLICCCVAAASTLFIVPLSDALYLHTSNSVMSLVLSSLIIIVSSSVLFSAAGFIVPDRLAKLDPRRTVLRGSTLFLVISSIFVPLAIIGGLFASAAERILRPKKTTETNENQTEEKILMMVDEGEENGTIEENTKSMIENVFDFDDTTVGEIMTHRKDVVAVRDDAKLTGVTRVAVESGCSRIPVYHEDIDNIIGIIHVKDLLRLIGVRKFDESIDKSIIREAVFVPESKRCSEMFEYMTSHKTQIAVVVDEFGGTGGIITMEDLIESILGSIQDEYDHEDDEIKQVNDYSFRVDGATSLDEIEDLTGISFEGDPNDTIAGIMLDRMGHIPKNGEHPSVMIDGVRFTVVEVDQRRISKVLIVKKHTDPEKNKVRDN